MNGPTLDLKILSLNMGYNIMGGHPYGSEKPMVEYCTSKYGADGTAQCTRNALPLILNANLIGLQEINVKPARKFLQELQQLNPHYEAHAGYYFDNTWAIWTLADTRVTGKGIQITAPVHRLDHPSHSADVRALQMIFFPKIKLLFINLHAPHKIPLKESISNSIKTALPQLMANKVSRATVDKIAMTGDFNDDSRRFLQDSVIKMFDIEIAIPIDPKLMPTTCCTDQQYKYAGDYILVGAKDKRYKLRSYGVPTSFKRWEEPVSDHDPLAAQLTFY